MIQSRFSARRSVAFQNLFNYSNSLRRNLYKKLKYSHIQKCFRLDLIGKIIEMWSFLITQTEFKVWNMCRPQLYEMIKVKIPNPKFICRPIHFKIYVFTYECIYVYIYECLSLSLYIYIHIFMNMCTCLYMHTHTCIYIPNLSVLARYSTRSIFKQGLTVLNSEFSFF